MNDKTKRNQDIDARFGSFLLELQQGHTGSWNLLVKRLRQVTIPWLIIKTGQLPGYALQSNQEFSAEVFAESLVKFYELFAEGEFSNYQALQSLMFRIAELKLKEGLARIQKFKKVYRSDSDEQMEAMIQQSEKGKEKDLTRQIQALKRHMSQLPEADRVLLQRYYRGEKLIDIARDMDITEASCRKRKQRALEKLKKQFNQIFVLLMSMQWIDPI